MELAIVIPYYKIDYFEECLESLAAQTNKNFKVYIGNDFSPQDPSNLLEKYADKLNFHYHRFHNNLGGHSLIRQWHRCINLSQGERWIMILGDDDYISENYIEEFYNHLHEIERLDIKVVRFASKIIRCSSNEISELYTHPKIESSTDFVFRRYFEGSRGSLTEQIFRRDMFLKYGFANIPLGWGADLYAWLQFSQFGDNYAINKATAFFRISDLNISRGGYMEEEKASSRIDFLFNYILANLKEFAPAQRLKFIQLVEQVLYKNKKFSSKYFTRIGFLFIKEKNVIQLIKFHRRFAINLINEHNSYSWSKLVRSLLGQIKFNMYHFWRRIIRQYEAWQKTEFERRIWKRQQLLFGTDANKELSNLKLYRYDNLQTWVNQYGWQRRLENKLNAKEFVLKAGVKAAEKLWNGRLEDFKILNISSLPENFIVKPVRGEASKNVYLMKNGYNLFDKREYDTLQLRQAVNDLYQEKDVDEIIIEQFLPNENGEIVVPNDYRFYMFNGEVIFIQLDKRKSFEKDQVSFYDKNWNLIEEKVLQDATVNVLDPAPACLSEMLDQAILLSKLYKNFVRIDFYATNQGAVFGEFTPTPRKGKTLTKFGNKILINAWDTYCKDLI